jgi:hypothetical protein
MDGWDTHMVEPERGTFLLMPAYFYHATEQMGVKQERILCRPQRRAAARPDCRWGSRRIRMGNLLKPHTIGA